MNRAFERTLSNSQAITQKSNSAHQDDLAQKENVNFVNSNISNSNSGSNNFNVLNQCFFIKLSYRKSLMRPKFLS